ncbi:MAG: hypothetical protein FWC57_01035 [Endomicrobia bacterium]|nr:hypothetical protein [Endomicrobiia bacterium]
MKKFIVVAAAVFFTASLSSNVFAQLISTGTEANISGKIADEKARYSAQKVKIADRYSREKAALEQKLQSLEAQKAADVKDNNTAAASQKDAEIAAIKEKIANLPSSNAKIADEKARYSAQKAKITDRYAQEKAALQQKLQSLEAQKAAAVKDNNTAAASATDAKIVAVKEQIANLTSKTNAYKQDVADVKNALGATQTTK